MMYIDNEVLEKMIMTIVEGFDRIEKKLDRMGRVKEFLNGDELLDNYDIARLLNVSLRTVARYREKGLIRYYQTEEERLACFPDRSGKRHGLPVHGILEEVAVCQQGVLFLHHFA